MEKLRYYVKYTYGYYWSSLSYLSIFLSIVLILGLPQEVVQLNIFYKILITIGIFVLTFLITLLWYVLFKKKVIVNLQQDKTITVKCGDIFTQNGNIVMPVNLYFDTLVKDGLVAEKSIHGQFVKKIFGGNVAELDEKIEEQLKDFEYEQVSRSEGKSKKYPYGTIIKIPKDNTTYFLVALSDFDSNNHAFCSAENYFSVLTKLASYIGNNSEGKTVSMPAIGTGLSRINSSLNVCIRNIVQVFRIVNPPIIGGVQIVIEESSCWKVDMRII